MPVFQYFKHGTWTHAFKVVNTNLFNFIIIQISSLIEYQYKHNIIPSDKHHVHAYMLCIHVINANFTLQHTKIAYPQLQGDSKQSKSQT